MTNEMNIVADLRPQRMAADGGLLGMERALRLRSFLPSGYSYDISMFNETDRAPYKIVVRFKDGGSPEAEQFLRMVISPVVDLKHGFDFLSAPSKASLENLALFIRMHGGTVVS